MSPPSGFTQSGTLQTPSGGLGRSLADARAAELLSDWRLTPATLMHKLDPTWIPAKWLQYLSFKIAGCIARGNCGLLISAPPRHGKSLLSTIATPLWVLENFPHYNVVVSTYGEELSTDFSRQIRDHIQNNQDLLSVRLRSDTQRVTNFLTTKGGGLKAVGLRGAITGRGANVFVLDDYIKEPKEAMSPTYLEDLYTWWLTVARTRLEPGAVVIILATRWVPNDIHGRIMKHQREKGRSFFEYVELPAIYEPTKIIGVDEMDRPLIAPDHDATDAIGRHYGDVLFPERYNRSSVLELREDLGSRWFNAMFQQKPDDDENAVIKTEWFKKISQTDFDARVARAVERREVLKWGRGWDMASTQAAGDFTSGALALYNKSTGEFFIRNINRGQYSPAKAELEFVMSSYGDASKYEDYLIAMEQEPGSSGKYSVRHFEKLLRDVPEGYAARITNKVEEQLATSSKLLNAQPLLAAAENGKVYVVDDGYQEGELREHHHWNANFYTELETYPEGAHDDQVDSVALIYKKLSGKKGLKAAIGRTNSAKAAQEQLKTASKGGNPGQRAGKHKSSVTFGRRY